MQYVGPYQCDTCGNPQPTAVTECVCCDCSNDTCNVCADAYGRCVECAGQDEDCKKEAS